MPCPFTGPKMFWAGPKFLSHPKHLTAFSAFSKTFVPAQKTILLNANPLCVGHKIFVTATCLVLLQVTKYFGLVNIFCDGSKICKILCQSQTFCARLKDGLHSVKLFFVLVEKFVKEQCIELIFGGWLKNLDQHKTF